MMVAFPIFFVVGMASKSAATDKVVSSVFVALLAIMTLLCTIIVTLALS
jgi:hypothetical protein